MKREYKIALSQEYYSDVVYLSQYDTDYDIEFTVLDKYAKATGIDGYTAKLTGTRCDGLGFTFESTASDETVSFEINTSLTAISGTHKGEIVFYDTNGLFFGSANVQIVVEPAARPDGTIDADVERAQEIAEQIQQIVDTAAEQTTSEAERIVDDLEMEVTELKSGFNDLYNTAYVTDSASGGVAHFVDGADSVPMKSLKVAIVPVQSGSGDPSPDNVRPITGFDVVKVYHSGENTEEVTEYDISLSSAGTVYGGMLDVVSGELTVDRAIVDLGSLSWGYSAPRFYSGSVTDGITPSDTGDLNAICEKYALYETGVLASQPDLTFFVNSSKMSAGTKKIVIRDRSYTDAQSLKASLDGIHLVYTLANPQTYQLTPQQVNSLLGVNNVWCDAGDVEVEYRADTKLYIDKKLGV